MDNPDVTQLENFRLKVFRTVAEHLSFRKAAEQLFLTQPAVTLQIKALEDDLGVRLFDRTAGRVSLKPQGVVLLRHAQRILQNISEAERELARGSRSIVRGTGPGSVDHNRAIRSAAAHQRIPGRTSTLATLVA